MFRRADINSAGITPSTDGSPTQGGDSSRRTPACSSGSPGAASTRCRWPTTTSATTATGPPGHRARLRRQRDQTVRRRARPRRGDPARRGRARRVRVGFLGFNAIGETPRAAPARRGRSRCACRRVPGPSARRPGPRAGRRPPPGPARRRGRGLPHWGTHTRTPPTPSRQVGRRLVAAGADLVVGGHPHWVQALERYDGATIATRSATLVFDMDFMEQTMEGVALTATIWAGRVVDVGLAPYRMDASFSPRLLRGPAARPCWLMCGQGAKAQPWLAPSRSRTGLRRPRGPGSRPDPHRPSPAAAAKAPGITAARRPARPRPAAGEAEVERHARRRGRGPRSSGRRWRSSPRRRPALTTPDAVRTDPASTSSGVDASARISRQVDRGQRGRAEDEGRDQHEPPHRRRPTTTVPPYTTMGRPAAAMPMSLVCRVTNARKAPMAAIDTRKPTAGRALGRWTRAPACVAHVAGPGLTHEAHQQHAADVEHRGTEPGRTEAADGESTARRGAGRRRGRRGAPASRSRRLRQPARRREVDERRHGGDEEGRLGDAEDEPEGITVPASPRTPCRRRRPGERRPDRLPPPPPPPTPPHPPPPPPPPPPLPLPWPSGRSPAGSRTPAAGCRS